MNISFSRLRSSLLILAGVFMLPVLSSPSLAEAPMVKTQVPGFYRLMLGKFEVTALLDGTINLDTSLLRNISEIEIKKLLVRGFIDDPRKVPTSCNAYLINTGSKLILIDAGSGQFMGPSCGKLPENLKAAGYSPEQIDIILITHLHADHFGGLLSADGKPAFPKAMVYVAKAENDFWTSDVEPKLNVPEELQQHLLQARKQAIKVADQYRAIKQWKTFENADLPVDHIKAVPLLGHTPGHMGYEVASEGKSLLVIGDVVHFGVVQFPVPNAVVFFDADTSQAASTRKEIFQRLAGSQTLIAGMHLSCPGIGHLRQEAEGSYSFVPFEYSPLPEEQKEEVQKKLDEKKY
jgi:glyoxylase-like metal-dependent hydrolase (beta-lactamase superfamily II)